MYFHKFFLKTKKVKILYEKIRPGHNFLKKIIAAEFSKSHDLAKQRLIILTIISVIMISLSFSILGLPFVLKKRKEVFLYIFFNMNYQSY